MTLYWQALGHYMPSICGRKIVGLTLFACVFLGAQTDIGIESSGGIHPLVAATTVYILFMTYANLSRVKGLVLRLERTMRDAILATIAVFAGVSAGALILTNSELLAMRYFTMASIAYAVVYAYGFVNRTMLTDYLSWPWSGLTLGVRRAGIIMALTYVLSAILSEYMIANGSVGAWALMRLAWPVAALRLGHALIVADQLWLRRTSAAVTTA
ncbi:hypothetical protein ACP2AV_11395 [Aliiroseovarius sp. PTFE2010]|uniref:hypothetical protein n=1 Tax=Aliiroseovarius sp. PTFE2010 TaxID=3417190 RepID=UPI003CE7108C